MKPEHDAVWRGEASAPDELADELAVAPSCISRLPGVKPIEVVTFTCSTANRDLMVQALRLRARAENAGDLTKALRHAATKCEGDYVPTGAGEAAVSDLLLDAVGALSATEQK